MTSGATNNLARKLGPNIRAARMSAGLTQKDVAVQLGLQPMAVSNWERAEAHPTPENLAALARLLGREVAWFYTPHGEAA